MKLRELLRSVFGPSTRNRDLAVALVRVRTPRHARRGERRRALRER